MDSREEIAHTPIQPHTKAASSFSSQSALLYEIEWGKKGPLLLILLSTLFATFSSSAKKISPTNLLSSSDNLISFHDTRDSSDQSTEKFNHIRDRQNLHRSSSSVLKRRTIFLVVKMVKKWCCWCLKQTLNSGQRPMFCFTLFSWLATHYAPSMFKIRLKLWSENGLLEAQRLLLTHSAPGTLFESSRTANKTIPCVILGRFTYKHFELTVEDMLCVPA